MLELWSKGELRGLESLSQHESGLPEQKTLETLERSRKCQPAWGHSALETEPLSGCPTAPAPLHSSSRSGGKGFLSNRKLRGKGGCQT